MIALATIGVIAMMVGGILWRGYVLSILWAWFVVTTFALPALTIAQALGVSIVVGMLTHQNAKDDRKWGELAILGFLAPLMALFIGWIVRGFLP